LSYKKSRLIPGKILSATIQEESATFLHAMFGIAQIDSKQVLSFLDPMHQVHNNENDYSWQFKGKDNTKQIKANTGEEE